MSQPTPQTSAARRSYLALLEPLRSRNFLYFWYAETMSRFGNQFQSVALATVALALTGEASALAGVLMVQNIPAALLALIGGVVTLCSTGVFWLSYAMAGVVAKQWGPRGVILVLGVFMPLLACLVPYFNREYGSFRVDVR